MIAEPIVGLRIVATGRLVLAAEEQTVGLGVGQIVVAAVVGLEGRAIGFVAIVAGFHRWS